MKQVSESNRESCMDNVAHFLFHFILMDQVANTEIGVHKYKTEIRKESGFSSPKGLHR